MKPFDPKTAKNGDKLTDRNGFVYYYIGPCRDGTYSVEDDKGLLYCLSNYDMFTPKTKRTVWINVYADTAAYKYDTAYEADARKLPGKDFIGTYPLEIEE